MFSSTTRSNVTTRVLVILLLAATAGPAFAAGALEVGTCKRDITPVSPGLQFNFEAAFGVPGVVNHTDPVFIAGFGDNRPATVYNDRLWARGVVIDRAGVRIAILSLDLIGYTKNEVDTARALIAPASGIDLAVIVSTNQHEGPDTIGIWGPDALTTGIDFGYLDFVNSAIADCIDEAAQNLTPARVYFATTDSSGLSLGIDSEDDGFGVSDGKVLENDETIAPDTEGRIVDPSIGVIQLTRTGGARAVLATIVNFASRPESLGSNNTLITSDFPHYARERVEAEYGGLAIWLSSDLGVLQGPLDIDVLDPLTGAPAVRRTFRWADVHGTQLAERAIAAADSVRLNPSGRPVPSNGDTRPEIGFSAIDPVPVRLDNPFLRFFIAIDAYNVRRQLFTDLAPDPTLGFPFPPPFETIPQALGEDFHTEVSVVRIGDAALAVVPTEVDPQIGVTYRNALVMATEAEHTFILGLGSDEIGHQIPASKWDDSCHACAPFILAGVPQFCPLFPNIDCNTVFQNNLGQDVDPAITDALLAAIGNLTGVSLEPPDIVLPD